jgi:hypothetical protein
MGAGASKTESSSRESALSKQQASIVAQREAQFQRFFFPELLSELQGAGGPGRVSQLAESGVGDVNRSFQSGQRQLDQSFAQRGLTGSGLEAQALTSLNRARSSSLSNVMHQARMAETQRRGQLLQMGGALAPTPTTAAPLLTDQSSKTSGQLSSIWK